MNDKKSFIFYSEFGEQLNLLSEKERGRLISAIIDYVDNGKIPLVKEELTPQGYMAFSFIKRRIDYDTEKWNETKRKRSEAGKKGGRPRKYREDLDKENEDDKKSKINQEEAKKTVNDNVNDNVIVTNTMSVSVYPATAPQEKNESGEKKIYGELGRVRLSESEYDNLNRKLGENTACDYIERLDLWLAQGHEKNNHYATILSWYKKDSEGEIKNTQALKNGTFDTDDFFAASLKRTYELPKESEKERLK